MKKYLGLSLILVVVLALSTSRVLARGGGHGGGHHGGGHHGGHHGSHHHSSHHHSSHHHSHHGSHYHHSNWAHHNRPFSHGWYGGRGGAWGRGWGGWGWGNPWGVATFGTAAAFLGLEAAEPIVGNYGTVPTVYTSAESDDAADATDPPQTETSATENTSEDAPANAASQNEALAAPDPAQAAQAEQLAKSGATDPPKDTAFLPLGVFSLAPQGQTEASALVQLAISKTGQVRGTYYDLLTDKDQPIRGAIDKKSQQVAFTFGEQGKVVFETSLANLTQKEGAVAAHFENGQKRTWILARYEKEPTPEGTPAAGAAETRPAANPETAVQ